MFFAVSIKSFSSGSDINKYNVRFILAESNLQFDIPTKDILLFLSVLFSNSNSECNTFKGLVTISSLLCTKPISSNKKIGILLIISLFFLKRTIVLRTVLKAL